MSNDLDLKDRLNECNIQVEDLSKRLTDTEIKTSEEIVSLRELVKKLVINNAKKDIAAIIKQDFDNILNSLEIGREHNISIILKIND